jgi:hypothetical protein
MNWTIEDYTKSNGGYMRIFCDGERAADVFPFAADQKPDAVKSRALLMVRILNEAKYCETCGSIDGLGCGACP